MTRAGWGRLAAWVVIVALAVIAARTVDWRAAAAAARGAHAGWLLVAVAANASILFFATLEWRQFFPRGATLSLRETFPIVALTSSVANGAPAIAGYATAVHLLATRGRLGHAAGLSVKLLDGLAEIIVKLGLLIAAALVVPGFGGPGLGVALGLIALTGALAVGLSVGRGTLAAWLDRCAEATGSRAWTFAATTVHQLDALDRPGRFAGGVALGVAKKVAEGCAIAAAAHALGVGLPGWAVVAALLAVNLASFVAVAPGNLGAYEAGAFLAFRAAGVDPASALALALIQHAAYLIPVAGTGWLLEGARMVRQRREKSMEDAGG